VHQALECRAVIGATADRPVFIGGNNGQTEFCSVLPARLDLLLNGNIPLVMG